MAQQADGSGVKEQVEPPSPFRQTSGGSGQVIRSNATTMSAMPRSPHFEKYIFHSTDTHTHK